MSIKECKNKCPYCDSNNIWINPEAQIEDENNLIQLWHYFCDCPKCNKSFTIIERHTVEYVHTVYYEE